jgi:hypothetical protein
VLGCHGQQQKGNNKLFNSSEAKVVEAAVEAEAGLSAADVRGKDIVNPRIMVSKTIGRTVKHMRNGPGR